MAMIFGKTTGLHEYNLKDLSQADFGLGAIELAEVEMPGLMALVFGKNTGGREYNLKDLSQADFGLGAIELGGVEMPGLMALVFGKNTGGRECNLKDLSQADFGLGEIELAGVEMPGLMALVFGKNTGGREFNLKDLSKADFGLGEIELGGVEMPGLMALVFGKNTGGREYNLKDLSKADFGLGEIELAEVETPGLMACRAEFGPSQPFKGAKTPGSLHMTIQTAFLIETLTAFGAEVRWCSCNIFFAGKGETLQAYWWCTERGDATLLIHEGVKAEEVYAKTGQLSDPSSTDNAELQIVLTIIRDGLKTDPLRYHKMKDRLVGVSEATTSGFKRLYQMQGGTLLFSAINVNDSDTKSNFNNLNGCRHSLPDGLMRATDVMIAGKVAIVCGYGDVGKGCAAALKQAGARVIVTEIDPICALQALMEGLQVLTLEAVVSVADISVTTTGNKDIIMVDHMRRMKNNAIVCNIGHFDNEIDMLGLETYPGVKRVTIKPQTDRWVFPEANTGIIVLAERRLKNLGCATGHPSFVMSCSFTNQVIGKRKLKGKIWVTNSGKVNESPREFSVR